MTMKQTKEQFIGITYDELLAENAKLRELCKAWYKFSYELFDEFIAKRECGVLWIVGEPGHGKTSMCIKAIADFSLKKRYLQVFLLHYYQVYLLFVLQIED